MYEGVKVQLTKFNLQEGDFLLVQSPKLPIQEAQGLRDWITSEYPGIKVLVLSGQTSSVIRIPKEALTQIGAQFGDATNLNGIEVDMANKQIRGIGKTGSSSNVAQVRNTIRNIQGFVKSSAELQQISPVATRALNQKLQQLEEMIEQCLTF